MEFTFSANVNFNSEKSTGGEEDQHHWWQAMGTAFWLLAAGAVMILSLVTSTIVGIICKAKSRALFGFEEIDTGASDQPFCNEDPTTSRMTLLQNMEEG